ncbi:hypothetical protein Gogos_020433, partial [Gossypium gossypioides]|nr:hypothetical protein [Gossypium gossypioides]
PLAQLSTWIGQARVKPPEIRLSKAKPAFHHLNAPTQSSTTKDPTRHNLTRVPPPYSLTQPTTVLSTSRRHGSLIYPFSPFVVKICTALVGDSVHLPLSKAVPKMKPFEKLALLIFCEDPAWIPKASNNVIIGKAMAFSTKSLIRLLQKIDMR